MKLKHAMFQFVTRQVVINRIYRGNHRAIMFISIDCVMSDESDKELQLFDSFSHHVPELALVLFEHLLFYFIILY